ncbi:hypothetical protein, partial [Paraburkholderia kirstenboschensis]|uniref:hypothetical protein n=1 Tax=Paraburkholderia kirstenboschensis TaxID=1245436 RepID=UPI001FB30FFC
MRKYRFVFRNALLPLRLCCAVWRLSRLAWSQQTAFRDNDFPRTTFREGSCRVIQSDWRSSRRNPAHGLSFTLAYAGAARIAPRFRPAAWKRVLRPLPLALWVQLA